MAGKRARNQTYEIHGGDTESLHRGFDAIGMPERRRSAAIEIVTEVLAANDVKDFYWYMPPTTPEVSCYWDDATRNLLWVTAGEVHVTNDPSVLRPPRPTTWSKASGDYVGWLLPGADASTGGGALPKPHEVETALCPVSFVHQPAGVLCPDCEIVHVGAGSSSDAG